MCPHPRAKFNIKAGLEDSLLSLGACSDGPGGLVGIQINEVTCANGLGKIVAAVIILLNMRCYFLLDGSKGGIVGGGSIHTELEDDFLLGGSCTLLGIGALVAPGFILVVAIVASSTFARTS